MMKRLTAIILALLLAMPAVLSSCAESEQNTNETSGNTPGVNASLETEDVVERLYADVPADANFGGRDFTILSGSNSEYSIVQNDFMAEEISGEPINDARYNRNITIVFKSQFYMDSLIFVSIM